MDARTQEDSKRRVKMVLYLAGMWMLAAGLVLLTVPAVAEMLKFEPVVKNILGGSFMLAGVTDIVISRLLFRTVDRK